MEMRNCKNCGKVFASLGERICPECKQKEDESFTIVKEYIYDHPKASLAEVSEETGVDEAIIMRYIREGRIEVAEGSITTLTCEKCGKSITTGKYCIDCQNKLASELSKAQNSIGKKDIYNGPRMHSEDLRK